MYTSSELDFISQKEYFLSLCLGMYGYPDLSSVRNLRGLNPEPLNPVRIGNVQLLTAEEKAQLVKDFRSPRGVAYFIVDDGYDPTNAPSHPIHLLAAQLQDALPLKYPIAHALETHPGALAVVPNYDATVKLFVADSKGAALSAQGLEPHVDGLGCVGTVETAILFMESAPLFGGITHFRNVLHLALELAKEDLEAFDALFLPDSITVFRNAGSRALKVTGPVSFLGPDNLPKCFVRCSGGEYEVSWRDDSPGLRRARTFLSQHFEAFSRGTTFVNMSASGHGCIIHNASAAHGRTGFLNGSRPHQKRILARKWYAATKECQQFCHSPGVWVKDEFASLFPEYFGPDVRTGEWIYNPTLRRNTRTQHSVASS